MVSENKVWWWCRTGIRNAPNGAADLPTQGGDFELGDWVLNLQVGVGQPFGWTCIQRSPNPLFAIISNLGGGGGGGGGATRLSGSVQITVGLILDGVCVAQAPTILVSGAVLGDPVTVGSDIPLPTGVMAIGKVTSSDTVTVEIWNLSQNPVTPGTATYTAVIIH